VFTSNTSGDGNTACGLSSLPSNATGINNTPVGSSAILSNTSGKRNTVVGGQALNSNSTGNDNIALGFGAGGGIIDVSNVICIGESVSGFNVGSSCFIGNIFGASIGADASQVSIDSTGKLGTITSSRRFKKEIQPTDKIREAILAFRPVTFRYDAVNAMLLNEFLKEHKKSPGAASDNH
jgi:trimeric autotransporter adhesin